MSNVKKVHPFIIIIIIIMDIEWVIYHLIHNDDKEFHTINLDQIDLLDDDALQRLLVALRRNHTVRNVTIDRCIAALQYHDDENGHEGHDDDAGSVESDNDADNLFVFRRARRAPLDVINDLLLAVLKLPNLQTLKLIDFDAIELEELQEEEGGGEGVESDVDGETGNDVVGIFRKYCQQLETFHLQLVDGMDFHSTIPLALSHCTKLRHVKLELNDSAPLAPLLASSSLKSLIVESLNGVSKLNEEHGVDIANVLSRNTALEVFDLEHDISSASVLLAMSKMVSQNSTLKTLRLSFDGSRPYDCINIINNSSSNVNNNNHNNADNEFYMEHVQQQQTQRQLYQTTSHASNSACTTSPAQDDNSVASVMRSMNLCSTILHGMGKNRNCQIQEFHNYRSSPNGAAISFYEVVLDSQIQLFEQHKNCSLRNLKILCPPVHFGARRRLARLVDPFEFVGDDEVKEEEDEGADATITEEEDRIQQKEKFVKLLLRLNIGGRQYLYPPMTTTKTTSTSKARTATTTAKTATTTDTPDAHPDMVPKHVWIDRLICHSDDIQCLYYYISTNPTLCQNDGNSSIAADDISTIVVNHNSNDIENHHPVTEMPKVNEDRRLVSSPSSPSSSAHDEDDNNTVLKQQQQQQQQEVGDAECCTTTPLKDHASHVSLDSLGVMISNNQIDIEEEKMKEKSETSSSSSSSMMLLSFGHCGPTTENSNDDNRPTKRIKKDGDFDA